jgi:hypothetical protein
MKVGGIACKSLDSGHKQMLLDQRCWRQLAEMLATIKTGQLGHLLSTSIFSFSQFEQTSKL